MIDSQGVLICGEVVEEKITTVTAELMTVGIRLSNDLNQPLSLLLIGENIQNAANDGVSLGADNVYIVDSPLFTELSPELYVAAIANLCKQTDPFIILFGQTDMGRDIAPRLGARLQASVCLDCIELAIDTDTKSLLQTKPVYGGNAVAVWASLLHKPQVVAMRQRAAVPAEANPSRKGNIVTFQPQIDDSLIRGKLLETVKEEAKGIKLEEAKAIVAGGGGIGGREGFQLVQELAQILRGTTGISRVPCDEGWMPSNLEIGQTGHIVSPDLYVAIGISGAPQHLAGCSGSKCIIAINKDPDAHIFKEADYGIVGDYREILPPLIEKIKKR